MAPNNKIDRDAVLMAYEKCGQNGMEVARQLGIHQNSVYQITRIARGQCVRCLNERSMPRRTMCKACCDQDKERVRANRRERRRLGKCQVCEKQRSAISLIFCDEHRISESARKAAHKKAKRAGVPFGLAPSLKQRIRAIQESFGFGGVICWTRDDGRCQICRATAEDCAIHVHHIDEDKTNNSQSNLCCLCFSCHNTLHAIIRLRNRCGLISWFERTYPHYPLK